MKEEYTSLRQEILYWQNFRFILLGASIAFVSGVLGFVFKQSDGSESVWYRHVSLILFVLACAASFSCYAGRGNTQIGTYLNVFLEPRKRAPQEGTKSDRVDTLGWEGRRPEFRRKLKKWYHPLDWFTLNHWLAGIYLILGGVSATLLWYGAKQPWPLTTNQWMFIGPVGGIFLVTVSCLGLFSSPGTAYLNSWLAVEANEKSCGEVSTCRRKLLI